ncbi:hypothetical protein AX17_005612 [Amanita inopinata Kibby_2008]|nr:hypothetical protein AX17_005612 [Amanita inopinata Kibby_2008]
MPLTRSMSRAPRDELKHETPSKKRNAEGLAFSISKKSSAKKPRTNVRQRSKAKVVREQVKTAIVSTTPMQLVPTALTFSFEEGKRHLISVDARFRKLFSNVPCKPFEQLETIHPFCSLTSSILGQQISWMAARSINERFKRLFNPPLSELPSNPEQVSSVSIETLRTAGLSTRKAEYVKDLALRFVDGRLSADRMVYATDEQLARMLLEVRGIGRWTVDMFSIFSLRRPDILPVGDLGVQRGMLRWFLSRHSPQHSLNAIREKVGHTDLNSSDQEQEHIAAEGATAVTTQDIMEDTSLITHSTSHVVPPKAPAAWKVLESRNTPEFGNEAIEIQPLPVGLSIPVLESRLAGRKVKGAFLTPQEMRALSQSWKPYRSLGQTFVQ